jgi:hypothetical protein
VGSGYNSQDAAATRTAKAEWAIMTFTSGLITGVIIAAILIYIIIQVNS